LDYPGALPELYRGFTGAVAGAQQLYRSGAGVMPECCQLVPGLYQEGF